MKLSGRIPYIRAQIEKGECPLGILGSSVWEDFCKDYDAEHAEPEEPAEQ